MFLFKKCFSQNNRKKNFCDQKYIITHDLNFIIFSLKMNFLKKKFFMNKKRPLIYQFK